jgi:hypothetical protein
VGELLATLSPDRLVIGESGHRNFDAKPRAYEFASGCLGSEADVQINLPSSRGFEPVFPLEGSPRGDLLVTQLKRWQLVQA